MRGCVCVCAQRSVGCLDGVEERLGDASQTLREKDGKEKAERKGDRQCLKSNRRALRGEWRNSFFS